METEAIEQLLGAIRTGRLTPEQRTQTEAIVIAARGVSGDADWEASDYEGQAPVAWFQLDALEYALENEIGTYRVIRERFIDADWSPLSGHGETGVHAESYVPAWRHGEHATPEVNCALCPLAGREDRAAVKAGA